MKVDKIVKNAKVFTSDLKNLNATAFAVKDGKFVYVGDETGISEYEGDVVDMNGKFIMPALMDSHVHLAIPTGMKFSTPPAKIECSNKQECLDFIRKYVNENPSFEDYQFSLRLADLNGVKLTKDDLDEICSDKNIVIREEEFHSGWVNSKCLKEMGVDDDTPDIATGLSYYDRDENGHKTGYMFEMTLMRSTQKGFSKITDEQIREGILLWIDFCKSHGVSAVFEAGTPCAEEFHERVYDVMKKMDEDGELPIVVDGCFSICDRTTLDNIMDILKRYREKYNTEHMRFNTLKIMLDGTLRIHTASLLSPYEGTNTSGGCLFDKNELAGIIKMINAEGYNLHLHTVAEGAARTVLDAVELARKELGDNMRTQVTAAHLELVHKDDIKRFAELGVNANYTAWWSYGDCVGGSREAAVQLVGEERADSMYRIKSVYDTGANVCFSCDTVAFIFDAWNPYFGIEMATRRQITDKTKIDPTLCPYKFGAFPREEEKMTVEESIICYTINNAKQLNIDDVKGSIEVGKDADYLVFNEDLLTVDLDGFSNILPQEFYIKDRRV